MWICEENTQRFLAVNTASLKAFGYSRAEFLAMALGDVMVENLPNENVGRHAFVKKDGASLIAELKSSALEFEGKTASLSIVVDLSQQLESESKLRAHAERFDILSKATSDTIWDWTLSQNTIIWNKGVKGIFGYKDIAENTTNSEWFAERIHPDDRERLLQKMNQHLREKISRWKVEYRFRCADGQYKYISDRGFMLFDDKGKISRVIGAMEDISKRKEEEHWSKLLESVVVNATDGVVIANADKDVDGPKIMYVNKAFCDMTGYEQQELVGQSPNLFYGSHTNKRALKKLRKAFRDEVACDSELINYNKQGKAFWVSLSVTPVPDSTGKITHWISIQRDITENMKYVQAIEEQNKKFKEIAWIQSHIVRAPLARVMGLVDLLKDQKDANEAEVLIEYLTSSAKDLDSIIINIADKMPTININ
jgi:PAS domain S-box-containing protein